MKLKLNFLTWFIIIGVLLCVSTKLRRDGFATSPGTLDQLAAKGPQDTYLIGENDIFYRKDYPVYGRRRFFVFPSWW